MRTPRLFPSVLAALLAIAARPAFADRGPPPPTYRRPAQLEQTIAPTAQAHLEAARRALQTALDAMGAFDGVDFTLSHGGYFARAKEDTTAALAAVAEAAAFVRVHPETDVLAAGPAPAGEPKLPALPTLSTRGGRAGEPAIATDSPEARAADALQFALAALRNNPAPDHRGPVLGDLGGHRAKLITAIAQIGVDLSNGLNYFKNVRGGYSGVIPLSAPADLKADPKFGPTARTYLTKVQSLLDQLNRTLTESYPNRPDTDPTQGGYVPKVADDLKHAAANVAAALDWLKAHSDAAVLTIGPAGPEPSSVRRDNRGLPAATAGNRGVVALWSIHKQGNNSPVRRLNQDTITALNNILGWLMNNPAADYRGPVLGDLGGYRGKIMDDIGVALADTRAAFDYVLGKGPAANTPGAPAH